MLQRVLGLQINWHHMDRIPNERHVLVSNHLTAGDLMMLYSLPQHYVHLISAKLPKRISQASLPWHTKASASDLLLCNTICCTFTSHALGITYTLLDIDSLLAPGWP